MAGQTAKKPCKSTSVSKRDLWLRAYLDETNPKTYLNKTGAARAAGYNVSKDCHNEQIGWQNAKALEPQIKKWIDEHGLSNTKLQLKLVSLIDVKETRFQTVKGNLSQRHPGVKVMVVGVQEKYTPQGVPYTETENLIAIDVEDNKSQIKALDMALKLKDAYPSEKHDHNFRGNVTLIMELPPDDGDGPETHEIGKGNGG